MYFVRDLICWFGIIVLIILAVIFCVGDYFNLKERMKCYI